MMTIMKKQIIGMMCLAAMMSSCHIYRAYDRPETIDRNGHVGCYRYGEYGQSPVEGSVHRPAAAGPD